MKLKEYRKLHAEWYELVSAGTDHRKEIDFWARCIAEAGEPVLELGSGTGRVLVPLLERGFDVYGLDTSRDMMKRCRAACKAKGLKATLYEQSMLEFSLRRKFGLVILDSGGLGLFTSDEEIRSVFKRVMAHLKPGGLFVYEFEPVSARARQNWNSGNWVGDWLCGDDGAVIAWRQMRKYDVATQTWEILFIVDKFVDGRLVESEANEGTGRYFTVKEAVQFARSAGFTAIKATDWLTDDPPHRDSQAMTIRCRKPR